jgi:acetyl-CoA carboxylase biotin carboxyl carrier protein
MAKKIKLEPKSPARSNSVDLKEVERLLNFMQEHGLEEFEYKGNGVRIRLKKPSFAPAGNYRPVLAPDMMVAAPPSSGGSGASGASTQAREPASEAGRSEDLHVVKSPIVGTFYASASPGAQPFVAVGARVESGQVLCIIEAMKLMNEIESDVAGDVVRIFVENGQPVEYGEPLFGIHPHRKK